MTSAELYAELLLNIQQVTVFASLPTVANGSTKFDLSADRRYLSVLHDGVSATLELPCPVAGIDCSSPTTGLKELSFRLPVAGDIEARTGPGDQEEEETPIWPASVLSPETELACQSCKKSIVKETVSTWKDLPSENWAEMMDFWHCHKPDVKGAVKVSSDASAKGYAASNTLEPRPGAAFVDTMHFRLASSDCTGTEGNDIPHSRVECVLCHAVLGFYERSFQHVRLYKSSVCLRTGEGAEWDEPNVQGLICAKIHELINSQAVYKFVAHSSNIEDSADALMLWVLSPDLNYSNSTLQKRPQRAMKILYHPIDNPYSTLQQQSMKVEELQLPIPILQELRLNLQASSKLLPNSARKIQDWDVGFLKR